jgi:hypothetical protein
MAILINIIIYLPLLRRTAPATFCLLSFNPFIKLLYWYEVNPQGLPSLLVRPDAVMQSRSNP